VLEPHVATDQLRIDQELTYFIPPSPLLLVARFSMPGTCYNCQSCQPAILIDCSGGYFYQS
jgi:hypothetical protein